ncbi:MAG TPA: alpha/beta fold hydrolase [Nitriliruptorales bacterium]
MKRPVTIWSEGTRLAGDLFVPDDLGPGERRPALLLCHGWGGLKQHLSTAYAPRFCAEGFVVLTFDYRGWGESDGQLIRVGEGSNLTEAAVVDIRARVVREVVDPVAQALDVRNALDFLSGEEQVDADRIGLWGSSYGGGLVVWTAAHDLRVKAVVTQVASFGVPADPEFLDFADLRGRQRARGDLEWAVPQGIDPTEGLNGTPDYAKWRSYQVWDVAPWVRAPTLVIDADEENFVDVTEHGQRIVELIRPNAPVRYERFPCGHFDIYEQYREPATDLAVAWFREHLGPPD